MINLFSGEGCDIDVTKPFMRVTAFKSGGKWYSSKFTELDGDMLELINKDTGYYIREMFQQKDARVQKFLPVTGWKGFFFIVETYNCGFCLYHINHIEENKASFQSNEVHDLHTELAEHIEKINRLEKDNMNLKRSEEDLRKLLSEVSDISNQLNRMMAVRGVIRV